MSHHEHKKKAHIKGVIAVITVSDTRKEENDTSGQYIKESLLANGHSISSYHIVPDEPQQIHSLLVELLASDKLNGIILNGGTGVSKRDRTFETVEKILDKRIDGFGEIFRYLSYQDIGSAAIMSRATAGIAGGKVLFSVPGSTGAVKLAMDKLILKEISHVFFELNK